MNRQVVITGLGTISPLGQDVQTTWEGLVAGRSAIGPITAFDCSDLRVQIAAEVGDFDPAGRFGVKEARRMDRYTQLALAAAEEAVEQAQLTATGESASRIGVVIGSGIGGIGTIYDTDRQIREQGPRRISPFAVPMMLADTAPGQIAIQFGFQGPNFAVASACASGANAIGEAAAIIRRGAADVVIAGGADAGLVRTAVAAFANMGALSTNWNDEPQRASRPFDAKRDGFVAAEGAGILVLESEEFAKKRNAPILARFLGYGSSADAYHITAPAPDGAIRSMRAALEDAGIEPGQVDYLNAHGTSTPLNDKNETDAAKEVFNSYAQKLPISSTKSMTGHLLGAAGALEALICVKVIQDGIIPPTINYEFPDPECDLDYVPNEKREANVRIAMSNSFGFGGHNATLIIGVMD
ncbi:MAG: beta-ketoacyl-ACP synthase II [Anaerolineales bacterium]|nr:beta-ketoacyl-ACP synthase II [Anaerolineales bacterium]